MCSGQRARSAGKTRQDRPPTHRPQLHPAGRSSFLLPPASCQNMEEEMNGKRKKTHCSTPGFQPLSKSSSVPAATPTMSSYSGVYANRLLPHSPQKLRVNGCPESVV